MKAWPAKIPIILFDYIPSFCRCGTMSIWSGIQMTTRESSPFVFLSTGSTIQTSASTTGEIFCCHLSVFITSVPILISFIISKAVCHFYLPHKLLWLDWQHHTHSYTQYFVIGWFKRSLNQSIGSLCNPLFAVFWPDQRSHISRNGWDHRGRVTYNFFLKLFLRSIIRAFTGGFANVYPAVWTTILKSGSNFWSVKKWVMGSSWCPYLFFRSWIRACRGSYENLWTEICPIYMKVGQFFCGKVGHGS